MYPNYPAFKQELTKLWLQINEIYKDTESRIEQNKLNEHTTDVFNRMKQKFARIADYVDTLTDDAEETNANKVIKESAWRELQKEMKSGVDGLLDYTNDETMNRSFDDDNVRRMWRGLMKVEDLLPQTAQMEQRSAIAEIGRMLDDHNTQMRDYVEELGTFTEKYGYEDYDMLVKEHRELRRERDRWVQERVAYEESRALPLLEEEHTKKKLSILNNTVAMKSERDKHIREAKGYRDELDQLDKEILEANKRKEEYEQQSLRELKELEKKAAQVDQMAGKSMALSSDLGDLENEIANATAHIKMQIDGLSTVKMPDPKEEMPNELRVAKTINAEYLKRMLQQDELEALKNEFREELQKIGMDKLTYEESEKIIRDGENYSKMPKGILEQYRKQQYKGVTEPVALYELTRKYGEKFNEICAKFNADGQQVRTSAGLLNMIEGAIANRSAAASRYFDMKDDNPALNGVSMTVVRPGLESIAKAFGHIYMDRSKIAAARERQIAILHEKAQNEDQLHPLDEQNKAKGSEIFAASFANKVKELEDRKLAVQKKLDEANGKIEDDDAKIEAEEGSIRELSDQLYELRKKVETAQNNSDYYARKFNALDAKKQKLDAFTRRHNKLLDTREEIGRKLQVDKDNIINIDTCEPVRKQIGKGIETFMLKVDYGKKPDHQNSPEFTAMENELKDIWRKPTEGFPGLREMDNEELQIRLQRIHDTAASYLRAKGKEIRPFASTQRKVRLDFAKRLVQFTEQSMKQMTTIAGIEDAMIKQAADSAKLSTKITGYRSPSKVMEMINGVVANKQHQQKEAQQEAQYAAWRAAKKDEQKVEQNPAPKAPAQEAPKAPAQEAPKKDGQLKTLPVAAPPKLVRKK